MDEIFTPPHFEVEEPNEAQGLVGRIEKNVDQLDPGHPARAQLLDLSAELREREDIMDEARETIEKLALRYFQWVAGIFSLPAVK